MSQQSRYLYRDFRGISNDLVFPELEGVPVARLELFHYPSPSLLVGDYLVSPVFDVRSGLLVALVASMPEASIDKYGNSFLLV